MIIWINGAFGGGKTTTAFELNRRLEGSFVFDPENAGAYIRKNQPTGLCRDDFQDEPLWCQINLGMLRNIEKSFDGVIIVPMTITNPQYYHQIITALRDDGVRVDHYVLAAGAKTLRRRLWRRASGAKSWAAQQIPRCIHAFENPLFENHIKTDRLPPWAVADEIARLSGLQIRPPASPPVRAMQNLITSIRHIHWLFG